MGLFDEFEARVKELDRDITAWPYLFNGRTQEGKRFGQRCKVVSKAALPGGLIEVEFEDGQKVITSRHFVRKRVTR